MTPKTPATTNSSLATFDNKASAVAVNTTVVFIYLMPIEALLTGNFPLLLTSVLLFGFAHAWRREQVRNAPREASYWGTRMIDRVIRVFK
jgi:hypothetical protein